MSMKERVIQLDLVGRVDSMETVPVVPAQAPSGAIEIQSVPRNRRDNHFQLDNVDGSVRASS